MGYNMSALSRQQVYKIGWEAATNEADPHQ